MMKPVRPGLLSIPFLAASVFLTPMLPAGPFTETPLQVSEMVRIDLGDDEMIPGQQVTVPCFLEMTPQTEVGKIEMEVSFPHRQVSFDSIRRGLISDQIDAEITSRVRPSAESPDQSIVTIALTPRAQPSIPAGFLFDLVFLISAELAVDAPPIPLENQARAYRPGENLEPISNVESFSGFIHVSDEPPPVASCFFYMH